MASMVSAPATIPATNAATFTSALDPVDPGTRTWAQVRSCSPARSAKAMTGIRPGARHEVRVIESRRDCVARSHLPDVLLFGASEFSRNPIVPGQEDIRASRPAHTTTLTGGSRLSRSEILGRMAMGKMLGGLSSRRYRVGLEPVGKKVERAASATSKSAVSRRFVAMTETALTELLAAPLGSLDLVALMIDGVHFGAHLL